MKYYSIGEFSKLISKNSQTLRGWDKKDILKPHHVAPTVYRYYSQEQLNQFLVVDFKAREPIKLKKWLRSC